MDPAETAERLRHANLEHARRRPGPDPRRQPIHTVYGGAHLFRADTAARLGQRALADLEAYAPDAAALAGVLRRPAGELMERVHRQVRAALVREPVQDYRIDFEDGYGVRTDAEEDGHAVDAARQLVRGAAAGTLPRGIGIRIKALGEETRARAERTLRIFLEEAAAALPAGFLVTLPKVVVPEQPAHLAALLAAAERRHALQAGALRMELMVETPEALFDAGGRAALSGLVAAGAGRVQAAHFGAYDYTAALGITAAEQRLDHPACDWARAAMQVQLAGSGVWLVDGATTTLPVPPHRDAADEGERARNQAAVRDAWRLHADDVRHGLAAGFYQGWDLHPAQLVSRHAAVNAFFLESFTPAAARLRGFLERAARASRVGTAFDDAATGQGLLNYFRRALACGALHPGEVEAALGVPAQALGESTFLELAAASGEG